MKKQANTNTKTEEVLDDDIDNIFNFDKEEACYKGQYIDEDNKISYIRAKSPEQIEWDLFRAKCINPKTGKWFKSGNGTGTPKENGEGPKRIVWSIVRLKTKDNSEYLLSHSRILAFNQSGDPQESHASTPEKYQKTNFRFETIPNYKKGYGERRNTGPCGQEVVYTLPFTKENAQKLFELRDGNNIQFIVKSEDQGKVYGVKPQLTVQDTYKLIVENSFEYLYNALYISKEEKLLKMRAAEMEGIIPKQTDDERAASLLAQEALSDKQKHIAIQ